MNVERTRLYQKIRAYSPDVPHTALPFTARLARENRGSPQFARRAVEEYKKFMFLAVAPDIPCLCRRRSIRPGICTWCPPAPIGMMSAAAAVANAADDARRLSVGASRARM
jgi:hypothetical protein